MLGCERRQVIGRKEVDWVCVAVTEPAGSLPMGGSRDEFGCSQGSASECASQFLPMFLNRSGNHCCLPRWSQTPQTDQQNAGRRLPLPEDEFAEILVSRDQHAC